MVRAKDAVGRYGEDVAARYLTGAGMTLLARNWRCDLGEIDIVAREGDVLVVCEVKTRTSVRFGTPLEAITREKGARLRRLAMRWLADHQARPAQVRIDVVGVLCAPGGAPQVEHVRGAL